MFCIDEVDHLSHEGASCRNGTDTSSSSYLYDTTLVNSYLGGKEPQRVRFTFSSVRASLDKIFVKNISVLEITCVAQYLFFQQGPEFFAPPTVMQRGWLPRVVFHRTEALAVIQWSGRAHAE